MKCLILRRRTLTVLACALLAAAMFALVNAPAVAEASATDRQLPIYCVQRDQKMLAISFDAAWGNEDTQQLIDILGKYNVKATFFVVGDWVDKYPESVKALHDAALHTPEALPAILETLLQEGYTFVPISELILPGEYNVDYTIDHTGRQLPAQPSSSPR